MAPKISKELRSAFPWITSIRDAKQNITIEVTPDDCSLGKKKKNTECALAVACKRALEISGVSINLGISYLIVGNTAIRFATPERVKRELVTFDRHKDFSPGKYTLRRPGPSQRLGYSKTHSPKNGKKRRKVSILHYTEGVRYLSGAATRKGKA